MSQNSCDPNKVTGHDYLKFQFGSFAQSSDCRMKTDETHEDTQLFQNDSYGFCKFCTTLKFLIKVPVLLKKKPPKSLAVRTFFAVLLPINQEFELLH